MSTLTGSLTMIKDIVLAGMAKNTSPRRKAKLRRSMAVLDSMTLPQATVSPVNTAETLDAPTRFGAPYVTLVYLVSPALSNVPPPGGSCCTSSHHRPTGVLFPCSYHRTSPTPHNTIHSTRPLLPFEFVLVHPPAHPPLPSHGFILAYLALGNFVARLRRLRAQVAGHGSAATMMTRDRRREPRLGAPLPPRR